MKNEITVEKLEDGRVYLCKRLDENPLGMALGTVITTEDTKALGEAVIELLNSK